VSGERELSSPAGPAWLDYHGNKKESSIMLTLTEDAARRVGEPGVRSLNALNKF
jgi:hypothetical protein